MYYTLFLEVLGRIDMRPVANHAGDSDCALQGVSIIECIKKAGVKTIVALPDIVT